MNGETIANTEAPTSYSGKHSEEQVLQSGDVATRGTVRAAIVGTGYISEFHVRGIQNTDGVELVAVCDVNEALAKRFGAECGVPSYNSLEVMLAAARVDVVHVLTPPDLHHPLAKQALEAGVHVFLEKPMCASAEEASDLIALAAAKRLKLGVNHSMLFEGAYRRLRDHVQAGDLGPIDHVTFNYFGELPFIRFGPFGNWMLRKPGNVFLEIGSHPMSGLIDLVGVPDHLDVDADMDILMPGGGRTYRRWRIRAKAGQTIANVNVDLRPGFPQRTIHVRGLLGSATVDLDANVCTIDGRVPASPDFERYARARSQRNQIAEQARGTLIDYILSKAKVKKRGNPYQLSLQNSIACFYQRLGDADGLDHRNSAELGQAVIDACQTVIGKAGLKGRVEAVRVTPKPDLKPTILVIGGTGFIGKALIKQLLDKGHAVRVAARGSSPALDELGSDRLEMVRADVSVSADIERILDGVDTVFHLATTDSKSWNQFLEREVEPARVLGRACLSRGVKRLIYTGTIDSFYAGGRAGKITEDTPLDPNIKRRNNYARAKAAAEAVLLDLYRTEGLPLVIVRPGIVIGRGGNPFHWGVGKWASEGVVETWGDGTNKLPLVLVDDVAAGLVKAMETPGIEGRAYNLVDLPLLSAKEYIADLELIGGFKVKAQARPIWRFWLDDFIKWPVKVLVGHHDAKRIPSYADWESRSQKAVFDTKRTREELGWTPASDARVIAREGIGASLAGWLAART